MKKTLVILIVSITISLNVYGQDIVTNFESGINLALLERTVPPTNNQDFFLDTFILQHIKSNRLGRAIVDRENKVVFGYKLRVKEMENPGKFEVEIKSDSNILSYDPRYKDFARKSLTVPGKITVNDGDTIVLDILKNPETNGKIQDLIKITRERKTSTGYFSEFRKPKDFTLNDLSLQLINFKLYLGDKLLEQKPRNAVAPIVAPYIKGFGTFVLSPIEDKKGMLKKIGIIDDNKIIVNFKGKSLRIVSENSILGKPGKWNLWGKFEPETEKQRKKFDVKTDEKGNFYVEGAPKFIFQATQSSESYFETKKKSPVKRRRNILRFNN